jgi:hypothetical protein
MPHPYIYHSPFEYLAGFEDDLLDLHVVEEIISLHCLVERHDLIKHKSTQISDTILTRMRLAYPN